MTRFVFFLLWVCLRIPYCYGTDSIENAAVEFLARNCEFHYSPLSPTLEFYVDSVRSTPMPCTSKHISGIWNRIADATPVYRSDTALLSAAQLDQHAHRALLAWQGSAWRRQVDENAFLHYILPYRIGDEMLDMDGDLRLADAYRPLIAGVEDVKVAYHIICDTIFRRMREVQSACPYTLDAYTIHYTQQANCEQRCVLLVHLLRALGIPCTIDNLPLWGNYSRAGHSWVVLIAENKTFVYQNGKTQEVSTRPIDSARFPVRYKPTKEDHYPYPIIRDKRATKVYRREFDKKSLVSDPYMPILTFASDVSGAYGLTDSLMVPMPGAAAGTPCYLCVFRTGDNWRPVARAFVEQEAVSFRNLQPENVYLVFRKEDGGMLPCGAPFLLKDSKAYPFAAQDEEIKITLRRKYPIFSYWTNQWGNMKGSVIEGSNDADFQTADTLALVDRMPFGLTTFRSRSGKEYRYVRYRTTSASRTPIAILRFLSSGQVLSGVPIAYNVEKGYEAYPFDDNPLTVAATPTTGHWVGLAFSSPHKIDAIELLPHNDDNDIRPGHRYELFYYQDGWRSLGSKVATSDSLRYFVPRGALLLLKDRSAGHEERIFTYDETNKCQQWY